MIQGNSQWVDGEGNPQGWVPSPVHRCGKRLRLASESASLIMHGSVEAECKKCLLLQTFGNFTLRKLFDMCRCEMNKKQCSRQLQCEVPCGIGNVINSSLFINSSLSSLSSTSHTVHEESHLWWGVLPSAGGGGGGSGRGEGQGTFQSSCHNCIITWCFAQEGLRTMRWDHLLTPCGSTGGAHKQCCPHPLKILALSLKLKAYSYSTLRVAGTPISIDHRLHEWTKT